MRVICRNTKWNIGDLSLLAFHIRVSNSAVIYNLMIQTNGVDRVPISVLNTPRHFVPNKGRKLERLTFGLIKSPLTKFLKQIGIC